MGVGDRLDEGNVLDSPVNKNGLTRYFVTKHCEWLDRWKREIRSRLSYCKHRAMLCRAPVSGIISPLAAELMSAFPKQALFLWLDPSYRESQSDKSCCHFVQPFRQSSKANWQEDKLLHCLIWDKINTLFLLHGHKLTSPSEEWWVMLRAKVNSMLSAGGYHNI